jgi:anti-anti-sigma factor
MPQSNDHVTDLARIRLEGRLDGAHAAAVHARIAAEIDAGARHLVLAMDAVPFMSSAGIRVLQETHQRLAKIKGSLRIESASDFVREMLEIVGLYDLLGAVPARPAHPASEPIELSGSGLVATLTRLDPEARLGMEIAGPDGLVRSFPDSSFSIGCGTLAEASDTDQPAPCGTLVAAGGYAAYAGPHPEQTPDYMIYAPEFMANLSLREGRRWSGDFTARLDFSSDDPAGVALAALGQALLGLGPDAAIGFVLIGEASRVSGGRWTLDLSSTEPDASPREHGASALLIAGWIARDTAIDSVGAVFEPAPLRRGEQRLGDAVNGVFEQPLVDVLRLAPTTCLRRGALWWSPIAPAPSTGPPPG